ncbi:hypothetical protein R6Q57_010243 [Mikania cordata]
MGSVSMSSLVYFICCISLVSGMVEPRCIERERDALLRLKNGFVDPYGLLSSWSDHTSSQDCCLWRGVGCSNRTGHVTMLDLHGYFSDDLDAVVKLSGDINSSLLDLNHLSYLDLSFNSFTRIPAFVGSLSKLRHLNLSAIYFEVPDVPSQLGNLSNLMLLDLSYSLVVVDNIEWLYKLSSLEYINFHSVDLSESSNVLENMITQFPSLVELHLGSCLLPISSASSSNLFPRTNFSKVLSVIDLSSNDLPSSMIYPWLFNFSNSLTDINLSYNELNDTISEAFGSFAYLQKLDLTNNGLTGSIMTTFGNFSNLKMFYLGGNNLKQDLLSFFHILEPAQKSLQVLDLSSNELFGSLPDFTNFIALKELHLEDNEMKGTFPERFERVSNLVILDLAGNQITGLLPDLSALSSLQELYFERNRLRGSLADKILPLFELQMLGASANLLNGTISEMHLSNLSNLVYLDLSYNFLVFEIDPDWSPTFSLDVMSFSSCKLGPSFPIWLQTQKNFSILDISDTQINDSMPDWFWDQLTPNLRYLNLSYNQIHGIVPDLMYGNYPFIDLRSNNFYGLVPLFPSTTKILVLRDNMFSGSISFLCSLIEIFRLDLSINQLSGDLPDCWMNITDLYYLNLESNNFSGKIPTSMGSLLFMAMLSLRSNKLTGELPSSLKNCTMLILLDVGENSLSGRIPAWIGTSLTLLRALSLTSSGFHGNIPRSLCRLSSLQILDLSDNNLSGTIPTCIGNFKGMKNVTIANPFFGQTGIGLARTRLTNINRDTYPFEAFLQWKGRKLAYSKTLGLATILDLSSNNLNGSIPGDITNLTGLVALNLSRNNLSSQIPQDIGSLRWLDFLDLSRNHLVGGIPTSLSQLTNFGVLDLSYNNLSGRIPTSTQLQSFNASSYTGNPALCGLPLLNTCPGDSVPQNTTPTVESDDIRDQDKFITRGFFICLSIGLASGFWGFFGALILSNSWRRTYMKFLEHVTDWIYVEIAVNYNRLYVKTLCKIFPDPGVMDPGDNELSSAPSKHL